MPKIATEKKPQAKTPPRKKKTSEQSSERPVLWDKITTNIQDTGTTVITVDDAKALLGWETEEEYAAKKAEEMNLPEGAPKATYSGDYLLVDRENNRVRCHNNVTNRPLYTSIVVNLSQEILNKRWRFNGEPIIIGKTGLILNGQHTLISIIFAEQLRNGTQKAHWEQYWKEPCFIEKLIVFGVDEVDEVVNTMDTCKPRTLSDVIYRSTFFKDMNEKGRKLAAKITDGAVKFLWNRVGFVNDPHFSRLTHSEALSFLEKHPTVLKCARHIYDEDMSEDGLKPISKYISSGTACGLMYLMACTNSDGEKYRSSDNPSEKMLKLDRYDKAAEFWTLFNSSEDFREIKYAIGRLVDPESEGVGSIKEKVAIVIKGWHAFNRPRDNSKIRANEVKLKWKKDEDGIVHLVEHPEIGGVDYGDPARQTIKGLEDADGDETISDEEVKERKAQVDAERKRAIEETRKRLAARAEQNGDEDSEE